MNQWLSILYYSIGKQFTTNMRVSQSKKLENGDVRYYKWLTVLEVIGNDIKFSHRTLLINEIIVDIETRKYPVTYLNMVCYLLKLRYYIIDTTSKGYHIHLFDDKMFKMNRSEREEYREQKCDLFNVPYDKQLFSENHMISFEFEKHWKTGKMPLLVDTNMETFHKIYK